MKQVHVVAGAIAALTLLAPALADESEDRAEKAAISAPAEPEQPPTGDARPGDEAADVARTRCREFCPIAEIPVYVPPGRATSAQRIGGATRGGALSS